MALFGGEDPKKRKAFQSPLYVNSPDDPALLEYKDRVNSFNHYTNYLQGYKDLRSNQFGNSQEYNQWRTGFDSKHTWNENYFSDGPGTLVNNLTFGDGGKTEIYQRKQIQRPDPVIYIDPETQQQTQTSTSGGLSRVELYSGNKYLRIGYNDAGNATGFVNASGQYLPAESIGGMNYQNVPEDFIVKTTDFAPWDPNNTFNL